MNSNNKLTHGNSMIINNTFNIIRKWLTIKQTQCVYNYKRKQFKYNMNSQYISTYLTKYTNNYGNLNKQIK